MAKQRRSRAHLHERAEQRGLLAALVWGRREVLGLRQEEVADLAGCSPRFIHELEAGKPTLQLDKVLDVLNAIGLHLELADGGAGSVLATIAHREEPDLRSFVLDKDVGMGPVPVALDQAQAH